MKVYIYYTIKKTEPSVTVEIKAATGNLLHLCNSVIKSEQHKYANVRKHIQKDGKYKKGGVYVERVILQRGKGGKRKTRE